MKDLYLPSHIAQQNADQSRQHLANVMAVVLGEELDQFNRELKEIDPNLEVVWNDEQEKPVVGLKPGRFHLIRDNGALPPTIVALETDDGEFYPLTSGLFEKIQRMDLWNDKVQKEKRRRDERILKARENQAERERQERIEEIDFRLKAANNPGILFGGNDWSYKAGARKETKNK